MICIYYQIPHIYRTVRTYMYISGHSPGHCALTRTFFSFVLVSFREMAIITECFGRHHIWLPAYLSVTCVTSPGEPGTCLRCALLTVHSLKCKVGRVQTQNGYPNMFVCFSYILPHSSCKMCDRKSWNDAALRSHDVSAC